MPIVRLVNDPDLVFKALADTGRRTLLDKLHLEDGQTLTQLCEHLDMTRQAVTQHLQLLEQAGLVVTLRRGREKLHFINVVPLHQLVRRWMHKFDQPRVHALDALKRTLEGDSDE